MKNLSGLLAVLAIFLCATISYGQVYEKRINCGTNVTEVKSIGQTDFESDLVATGFIYDSADDKRSNNLTHNGYDEPRKSARFTKQAFLSYEFTGLAPGQYDVKLHFAEVYWGVAPGHGAVQKDKRHFSIDIDGEHSVPDFNIFAASGGSSYKVISETVTVNDGSILITLTAIGTGADRKNDPLISAIEILEQPPADIPVTGVSLDPTNAIVDINATQALNATVSPSDASNPTISWSSGDTSVAIVDSSTGLVTAVDVGTATITASTSNPNVSATATIEVIDPNNPSTGGNWSLSNGNAYRLTGNVGIGTTNPVPTNSDPNYRLAVNGSVRAKEVKVETGWADYVFLKDYKLPTLQEVEKHIEEKGHLINIPSAEEVEANGIKLGEMNKLLLEKIEELTLYVIEQEKTQKFLESRIKSLEGIK